MMSVGGFTVMFGLIGVMGYLAIIDKLGIVNGTFLFILTMVGFFVGFPKGFAYLMKIGPSIKGLLPSRGK